MSVAVNIADAVTEELNAAEWSLPLTAERLYVPSFELPDMNTLHVSVAPRAMEVVAADRQRNTQDVKIDVAVQKKFATGDAAEIDPLMALVEQIADFFHSRRLASYPNCCWIKTEHAPLYSQEHWDDLRQFTSVITFTWRVVR